jgi:CheY-like chemotaxis protein
MSTGNNSDPLAESWPAPAISSLAAKLKILFVEDHEDTVTIIERVLREAGYVVLNARSMASAIKAVNLEKFDVILSDISLPDGDGVGLLCALRQFSDAPAIALTGYGMPEDIERSRLAGFKKHLIKPISLETLLETITVVCTSEKAR